VRKRSRLDLHGSADPPEVAASAAAAAIYICALLFPRGNANECGSHYRPAALRGPEQASLTAVLNTIAKRDQLFHDVCNGCTSKDFWTGTTQCFGISEGCVRPSMAVSFPLYSPKVRYTTLADIYSRESRALRSACGVRPVRKTGCAVLSHRGLDFAASGEEAFSAGQEQATNWKVIDVSEHARWYPFYVLALTDCIHSMLHGIAVATHN
jgi:hypothetical protein